MNSQLVLSRHSLLGRRISRHLQELHGGDSSRDRSDGTVSRRKFLTNAAGAAGLAFWIPEVEDAAQGKGKDKDKDKDKSVDPKPIPGGVRLSVSSSTTFQLNRLQLPWQASMNH